MERSSRNASHAATQSSLTAAVNAASSAGGLDPSDLTASDSLQVVGRSAVGHDERVALSRLDEALAHRAVWPFEQCEFDQIGGAFNHDDV